MKKSFKEYLDEARRNPELNPDVSQYEFIENYYNKYGPDSFVTMTDVPKVGMNVTPFTKKWSKFQKHDTPLGIYCYPIIYVLDKLGTEGTTKLLPYAGSQRYINCFSLSSMKNVINLTNMTSNELETYLEKIVDYLFNINSWNDNYTREQWREEISNVHRLSHIEALVKNTGGKFWYITLRIAELISMKNSRFVYFQTKWNKLFRDIGINGFIDEGDGIIHKNEPTQAVFFNPRIIKNIERYDTQAHKINQPVYNKNKFTLANVPRYFKNLIVKIDDKLGRALFNQPIKGKMFNFSEIISYHFLVPEKNIKKVFSVFDQFKYDKRTYSYQFHFYEPFIYNGIDFGKNPVGLMFYQE